MNIPRQIDDGLATSIGELLAAGVHEIDLRCNRTFRNVERGLCNVRGQFKEAALDELGKHLTEETITSWLLSKILEAAGFKVELERHYPGSREECDLVIHFGGDLRLWIEVKYAWRHWFNCDGTGGHSTAYRGYLLGDESHPGVAHDFVKLSRFGTSDVVGTGVLLIGLDSLRKKMDADVIKLQTQGGIASNGWRLVTHRMWADRRNEAFRINCWFWYRNLTLRSRARITCSISL